MANYTIDKFTYGGNTYKLNDKDAMPKTGGTFTGEVTFNDTITASDVTADSLVVQGNTSVVNGLQVSTINGVTVGSSPKFTDTVTTATTSGSGNAVTAISASNGALTVTKGSTFSVSTHTHGNITSGGDITATAPTIASGDKIIINDESASKITNGPSFGTSTTTFLRNDGTWATPSSGVTDAFSTIDVGSTSINASGSDSFELAAGTGITLTPDASTNKITIASSGGGGSGDVVGPSSSTANHIVTFDNATGKKIKDSGLDINAATCHAVMSGFTTTAGSASSPYLSVKWKISGINGITAPYDGMRVAIKIPLAGVGTAGVLMSIDGGTTWHPVAYNINTVLTTHYPANTVKYFTYDASQTMTGYATAGTATTYTGVWKADADYNTDGDHYTTAWCSTAAATQAKVASCSNFVLTANTFIPILFTTANSYNGKITLNINSTGAKDIYINETVSSSSNKTLPAGTYIAYYDGSHYIINTNGTIPKVAPAYQYSTTDLTPGTSALTTGTLYFVYE